MKNTYKAYTGALWVRDCPFVALTSFIISATATHFLSLSLSISVSCMRKLEERLHYIPTMYVYIWKTDTWAHQILLRKIHFQHNSRLTNCKRNVMETESLDTIGIWSSEHACTVTLQTKKI